MENEKKDFEKSVKKDKIFFLIMGIATIILALIGATFAYFTATVKNVNGNKSVTITTATVEGIEYSATESLVLLDAIPGATANTSYTIKNPNASVYASYTMKLVQDVNNFVIADGANQLVMTISGGQLVGDKKIDVTDSTDKSDKIIGEDFLLAPGKTDTYIMKIEFVDTGVNQNTNTGKNFVGHVEVTQKVVTTNGN